MSDATMHGLSPKLKAKVESFVGSLSAEDVARMQQLAQEHGSAGEVPADALAAAPAALLDKLNTFAESLSTAELALGEAVWRAHGADVQGYLGTVIPSTYKQAEGDHGSTAVVLQVWALAGYVTAVGSGGLARNLHASRERARPSARRRARGPGVGAVRITLDGPAEHLS